VRLIGRVADGATETHARLILLKDFERSVVAEELVLVKNGGDKEPVNEILGVLREGLGKNEFLSHTSYRPDVAYMRYGGEPSGAREVYSFTIKPIGVITQEGLKTNRAIIQPRSPVYLLEEQDNPLQHLARGGDIVWSDAYIEGHPSWKVPVRGSFIPFHMGVYGTTGSGKSWFTRYILIPLLKRAGYRVLVLDWSGTDYAPYYEEGRIIRLAEVALDEESLISYLEDRTSGFSRNDIVRDAFDEFIERWAEEVREARERAEASPGKRPEELLLGSLREFVRSHLSSIQRADWKSSAERAFRRVFRRLKPEDLSSLMGALSLEDLLGQLGARGEVYVVDMGGMMARAKLGFFLSLGRMLYRMMEEGRSLNLALIIDEAPQYAPFEPRGIQAETAEMIKNLAALGRKRGLSLTLIAQGIKGEIGINAAVRRNLNTHFIGRIHPLDAGGEGGASEWLSPYGITSDRLLLLDQGRFYFTGLMSPSPVPLLITYSPGGV
jgi:hypothetical protein